MIPAEHSHLQVAAKSHPGMSGKNNEDRYAVSAFRIDAQTPTPVVFAIVSDGIGGHRAGEVAAEIAVEIISQAVANSDASQPIQTLQEAIIRASQAILVQAESNPEKKGMGATCACCWIIDDLLYTACVGDSRIYLIRENKITQLSTDHTWVQEAIQIGMLSPEQARKHPNAHVIRRYLGSRQPVEPDVRLRLSAEENDTQAEANQGLRLLPGDQLLLCSDGLTDLVNESEIINGFTTKEQNEAIDTLTALANKRGGHDNITIVSLRTPGEAKQAKPTPTAKTKSKLEARWTCLVVGISLAIIGLVLMVGAYLLFKHYLQPTLFPTTSPTVTTPAEGIFTETASPAESPSPAPVSPITPPTITATTTADALLTLTPTPTNTPSPP